MEGQQNQQQQPPAEEMPHLIVAPPHQIIPPEHQNPIVLLHQMVDNLPEDEVQEEGHQEGEEEDSEDQASRVNTPSTGEFEVLYSRDTSVSSESEDMSRDAFLSNEDLQETICVGIKGLQKYCKEQRRRQENKELGNTVDRDEFLEFTERVVGCMQHITQQQEVLDADIEGLDQWTEAKITQVETTCLQTRNQLAQYSFHTRQNCDIRAQALRRTINILYKAIVGHKEIEIPPSVMQWLYQPLIEDAHQKLWAEEKPVMVINGLIAETQELAAVTSAKLTKIQDLLNQFQALIEEGRKQEEQKVVNKQVEKLQHPPLKRKSETDPNPDSPLRTRIVEVHPRLSTHPKLRLKERTIMERVVAEPVTVRATPFHPLCIYCDFHECKPYCPYVMRVQNNGHGYVHTEKIRFPLQVQRRCNKCEQIVEPIDRCLCREQTKYYYACTYCAERPFLCKPTCIGRRYSNQWTIRETHLRKAYIIYRRYFFAPGQVNDSGLKQYTPALHLQEFYNRLNGWQLKTLKEQYPSIREF